MKNKTINYEDLINRNKQIDELKRKGLKQNEKEKVLKTNGFNKVIYLLNCDFESSSQRTTQYLEFHRTFKREFKKVLNPICNKIEISKPNHFDVSGFFQLKDNRIYYFSISDLRWNKTFLIRIAKDFKDYTGGSNNFINLDNNFIENLLNKLDNWKNFDKI